MAEVLWTPEPNFVTNSEQIRSLPLPAEYVTNLTCALKFKRRQSHCVLAVSKTGQLIEFERDCFSKQVAKVSRVIKLADISPAGRSRNADAILKFVSSTDKWYTVVAIGTTVCVYLDTPDSFTLKQKLINVKEVSTTTGVVGHQLLRVTFSNGEGELHTDYEQPVKADDPAQIGTSVSNALQCQVDKFTSLYEDAKRAEGSKRKDIDARLRALDCHSRSLVTEGQLVLNRNEIELASCDVEISRIRRFAIDSRVVFAYQLKNISQSNLSMQDVSLLSLRENGSIIDFTTAIANQEISLLELNSPSGQNNPQSIENLIAKLMSSDKEAIERSETKNSFLLPNGTAWMVQVIKLPNHSVGKVHSWIQTPNTKLKLSDFSTSELAFKDVTEDDFVYVLMSVFQRQFLKIKSLLTDLKKGDYFKQVLTEKMGFNKLQSSNIFHRGIQGEKEEAVILALGPEDTLALYGQTLDASKLFMTALYEAMNSDVILVSVTSSDVRPEENTTEVKKLVLENELIAAYAVNKKKSVRNNPEDYLRTRNNLINLQIETDKVFH